MNSRLLAALAVSLVDFGCNAPPRVNAAEDPNRAVGGVVYVADADLETRSLGAGPMFLTDIMIEGIGGRIYASTTPSCDKEEPGELFHWLILNGAPAAIPSHHGMRLFIEAGKSLCLVSTTGPTSIVWSGFRP